MNIDWKTAIECEQRVQQILVKQEIDGIGFDVDGASSLVDTILAEQSQIYNEIRPLLKMEVSILENKLNKAVEFNGVTIEAGSVGFLKKIFDVKGKQSSNVIKWIEDSSLLHEYIKGTLTVSGPFSRIAFVEPELSKREKLANQLIRLGWKPEEFTETGQPMLTIKGVPVDSLEKIEGDIGKKLARWFTIGHRLGVIKGWLEAVRPDQSLTAYCTGATTNTARRKHKLVANLPKAKPNVVLGKEMRSLFRARDGFIFVGYDAAALEGRVMGHYTYPFDDGEFANDLLHGDVHQRNADRFGISRDNAKTLFYGMVYGCSPGKLMKTFGWSKKKANQVWKGFWEENFALGKLRDKVVRIGTKYGYLQGIDGRKIWLRGSEHAWLNALFQSCGAIAMNHSLVILEDRCNELKIVRTQCAYYHDEAVDEVPISNVERIVDSDRALDKRLLSKCGVYYSQFGEEAVESIREAGRRLGLRCPLDSDYQIGKSWAEIH